MRQLTMCRMSRSINCFIVAQMISLCIAKITCATPMEVSLQRSIDHALTSQSGKKTTLPEPPPQSDNNLIETIKKDEFSGWVFGTVTQILSEDSSSDPVTKLFLAHKMGDRWVIGVEGSRKFGELIKEAPSTLLAADERRNLVMKGAPVAPYSGALPKPGLALPWQQNAGWYWTGGAHGWAGSNKPFNSLDFAGGDGRVLAPRDGHLYKSCERNGSAIVKLVHDNGYATTYYHMVRLTSLNSGARVRQGDYLGSIGNGLPCGGQTTGPHVHFSVSRDGNDIPVNGITIGGWQFFEGTLPYSGYATRNQRQVSPQAWLVNYGVEDPDGPIESPSFFSARVQAPGWVNLRNAPSLSAPIIGLVENGRNVQLACHKYGESVSGNWGVTRLWYRLDSNQWISDGFVYTGRNDPVVSACVG